MHPNAQLVAQGFAAFAAGDMATLKGIFAEDAVWHVSGSNRLSGDYVGIDAILRFFGEIASEASFDQDLHALLADDDGHVVALVPTIATRGAESLSGDNIYVFHVDDGKATEVWGTPWDQAATDAFWG